MEYVPAANVCFVKSVINTRTKILRFLCRKHKNLRILLLQSPCICEKRRNPETPKKLTTELTI